MTTMYERKDHFYKKAKKEGLASRAAYKLLEIQKKFRILREGDTLLELGAAPGGWLQILSKAVGPRGVVIGVDLLPLKIQTPANVTFWQKNIEEDFFLESLAAFLKNRGRALDAVLSDISPNLSGIAFRDTALSAGLAQKVFEIARSFLKPGGHLLIKIFPGEEAAALKKELRAAFEKLETFIPEATRKASSEVYLVAKGFKPR